MPETSKALVWDAAGERLYETGVKKGVLYVQGDDGKYPKGVAWNGLTGVTESPSGAEANAIYADDMKYLNLYSAEEFGATIEAYTYPDEFAECDGSAELTKGVNIGQQKRKAFGMCYRTVLGNDITGEDYGYKLQLITVIFTSNVVTQHSTIAHTKCFTLLLTDINTLRQFSRAITFCKFIRIGVSLDGCTELLCRIQVQILHIVGIDSVCFCTRRRFRNTSQTVPGNTFRILAVIALNIKNTFLYASLIQTLTGSIPNKSFRSFRHLLFLLLLIIYSKYIMIKIIRCEMPRETAFGKFRNLLDNLTIGI